MSSVKLFLSLELEPLSRVQGSGERGLGSQALENHRDTISAMQVLSRSITFLVDSVKQRLSVD